jgi:hypothetical protein
MNPKTSEKSPDWGSHGTYASGHGRACVKRLHQSDWDTSGPGAPGAPSSDGREPCCGARLIAPGMSSLWSANSVQTITMIAKVTILVIADPAPCMPVVARLEY